MGKHNRKSRDPRMLRKAAEKRSDKAIEREVRSFAQPDDNDDPGYNDEGARSWDDLIRYPHPHKREK